jgi:hypothetical protein
MMVTVVETTVGSACGEYVRGLEDSAIDRARNIKDVQAHAKAATHSLRHGEPHQRGKKQR